MTEVTVILLRMKVMTDTVKFTNIMTTGLGKKGEV